MQLIILNYFQNLYLQLVTFQLFMCLRVNLINKNFLVFSENILNILDYPII